MYPRNYYCLALVTPDHVVFVYIFTDHMYIRLYRPISIGGTISFGGTKFPKWTSLGLRLTGAYFITGAVLFLPLHIGIVYIRL